jgi:hypothetical protein
MATFTITRVPEIEKDLKKIRVDGFEKDFEVFLQALPIMVSERQYYHAHHIFPVQGLGKIQGEVFIAKKIKCKTLRATDKFRVVFQVIETQIRIIEVFYKNDKEVEDKQRILYHCQMR